ncbi:MAG: hypothetical protein ABIL01_26115 [Pseudomonadota bacterium]
MDATASGAQLQSQGEMNLVSGMRRADGRRLKTVFDETGRMCARSGESFGKTGADGEIVWSRRPKAGVKSCGDASGSTGPDCIVNSQGDGGNSAWLTGEITYKP